MSLRRPLNTRILAEDFAEGIFDMAVAEELSVISSDIFNAEMALEQIETHPTLTHSDYRCREFRNKRQRDLLRKRILTELIENTRLPNDDEIRLGRGGAKPDKPGGEAQAYVVSGAPASGKSGIAVRLADETGSYILDSDYAKRKLPEYAETIDGASLVHEEADSIIFGSDKSLFEYCVYSRFNMVIPVVGKTYKSMESIILRLWSCGYSVHLINVALDRKKCVCRAYERYKLSSRYVPLSYIFDEVGNEPERIYFQMKRQYLNSDVLSSAAQLSTDVDKGEAPLVLEASDNSPIAGWKAGSK